MSADSTRSSGEPKFIFGDQWPTRKTVVTRTPPERDRGFQPGDLTRWVSRQFAGVAAVVAAAFSGMSIVQQEMTQTVETGAGNAIIMGQPTAAFWWSAGFLGLAMLLMIYATGGGR